MDHAPTNRARIGHEGFTAHFDPERRFPLTPGFSPVWNKAERVGRFNGFMPPWISR